ncbi:MAG TPA: cupredoxin family copper-binding protein [Propionibacteriaceae bacterium]|nr:cupredoxin family copper-binding protein [Propionibacteriaceae bacterium]
MPASTARRGALALLLAALILFVLGSIEMARAATHAVTIADFAFSPPTLTITAGDMVTWTNEDQVVHTATSTNGSFDSGDLAQGQSFSFTFTTPGTYIYLCTPHPDMTGQIVVAAAAPAPTASTGGGDIPDVAMPAGWQTSASVATGLLLLGGAGLAVIARRPRE